ncbi:hypothetical protein LPJGGPFB_03158 [Ensifer adhaerens]|uniref:hypothetical protein n=1 Tax=Ensifer adhaerens TaxID=106592 RepID=UPI001569BB96|nr:hypothetical protein [Ensifer adhaerens]NRP19900.1 hypothetical protein [Ensifer adhaerens]
MNHDENIRNFQGRTQILIYRVNGEQSWQDAFDARRVVRDHPHEWALKPFSAADQKAALKHMPVLGA